METTERATQVTAFGYIQLRQNIKTVKISESQADTSNEETKQIYFVAQTEAI